MAFGTHHFKQTEVEKVEAVTDFLFLGSKITADSRHETKKKKKKMLAPWKESCNKHRQLIKKQKHHFADKGTYDQIYGFSSSNIWM